MEHAHVNKDWRKMIRERSGNVPIILDDGDQGRDQKEIHCGDICRISLVRLICPTRIAMSFEQNRFDLNPLKTRRCIRSKSTVN
jgi:hypothetical protein